ncbi:MAG: SPOR domain-containing protein, partial [Gammaproteobacteria bacterium]
MDRQLIERMTGGVVLILLLVVIAPALLDGRHVDADELIEPAQAGTKLEIRTIKVGNAAQDDDVAPEVELNAEVRLSRPAPPAASSASAAQPVAEARPVAKPNAKKPVQLAQAAPPPKSSLAAKTPEETEAPPIQVRLKGQEAVWAVQLGSFSSRKNADKLARAVTQEGYESFVSRVAVSGKTMY